MNQPFPIHVRTLTGLEKPLAQELTTLGAKRVRIQNRVVICEGDKRFLYKANLWIRTGIRVLKPVAEFSAKDEKSFYAGIQGLDWSQWLDPNGSLAIDPTVYSSFTTHSLFIAQLAKDAIVDQFRQLHGSRPSVDLRSPDLRVVIALFKNTVQVFLDSSGESLHRRGYRLKAGEAPLSETLAAGIIRLSHWDNRTDFLDSMCGSGTFCIEAGLIRVNKAPGLLREEFGFQRWPDYEPKLLSELVSEAKAAIVPNNGAPIRGVEMDPEVVAIARQNVERAGLQGVVEIEQGDFFTRLPVATAPGTLVLNPPYDERMRVRHVEEFWREIGDRLRQVYGGWKVSILCGNLAAGRFLDLPGAKRIELRNGPIECQLVQTEISSESVPVERVTYEKPEDNPLWVEKATALGNRLQKNHKHLSKWAKREGVSVWRVYNRDIPELPFIVDRYGEHLHIAEVQRNHDRTPREQDLYCDLMVRTAAVATRTELENVHYKKRVAKKLEGLGGEFIEVPENGARYLANLDDYTDTGFAFDQRGLRVELAKKASGKAFLSLYGYTGAFCVAAARGGARSTTLVDTSSTYLSWAQRVLQLNGFSGAKHQGIRSDVQDYLVTPGPGFDLCVVEPPARSINRVTQSEFVLQRDYLVLLSQVLGRMLPGATVYFLVGYGPFQMDMEKVKELGSLSVQEISNRLFSIDLSVRPPFRCWEITIA